MCASPSYFWIMSLVPGLYTSALLLLSPPVTDGEGSMEQTLTSFKVAGLGLNK